MLLPIIQLDRLNYSLFICKGHLADGTNIELLVQAFDVQHAIEVICQTSAFEGAVWLSITLGDVQ